MKALAKTTSRILLASAIISALSPQAAPRVAPQNVIKSGVVEGRILSKGGSPVNAVRVGMLSIQDGTAPSDGQALLSLGQTDSEGRYRLENVPAGRYLIVAGPLDALIYFPGVKGRNDAVAVTVVEGMVLRDQDFQLTFLKVAGRVTGDRRPPANQVALMSRPTVALARGSRLTAYIAPDGSFEFPRVFPGRYEAGIVSSDVAPIILIVDEEDVTNLNFNIPVSATAEPTIVVRVTVEGGGPLPRFQLLFETSTLTYRYFSVSEPVRQLRLPSGEYTLKVMQAGAALPAGYFVKSMIAGTIDLRTQPLKVGENGGQEVELVLGTSGAAWFKVTGKVTGFDATPRTVTGIRLDGPAAPLIATVNADGSFEFPAVFPGTYQARLTPGSGEFFRSIVVGNADLTNLEIPVRVPYFKVEGRVADIAELKQSVPTPNERLGITLWPLPELSASPTSGTVGADGSFSVADVQPGRYRLAVSVCEFDNCGSTGGMLITVVDKDLTGLSVPSGRSAPRTSSTLPLRTMESFMQQTAFWSGPGIGTTLGVPLNVDSGNELLRGTIAVDNGATVPQFRVRFTTGTLTRTLVVNSSAFSIELPPGEYTVTLSNLPADYELRSITDGATNLQTNPLLMSITGMGTPNGPPRIQIRLGRR